MRSIIAAVVATLGLLQAAAASAEPYPAKQVTIVVPFAAGSGGDGVARVIAPRLSAALKVPVIVDNKAGASGSIAAAAVARAAPDGATLFITSNTTHSANPSLLKSIPYDPIRDFAPVARVGTYPFMLVVNPGVPARSVRELVAHAKANPGKLSYGYGNSTGIVAGESFRRTAGIDLLKVPYKSTPPALADVAAGHVSMMFIDLTAGLSQVKADAVRALAVTTAQRTRLMPALPSMQESGVADFDLAAWAAIFAPANTPKEIVARLNAELRAIIEDSAVRDQLAGMGFDAFSSTPAELDAFVRAELAKWTRLIKEAGIEPE